MWRNRVPIYQAHYNVVYVRIEQKADEERSYAHGFLEWRILLPLFTTGQQKP